MAPRQRWAWPWPHRSASAIWTASASSSSCLAPRRPPCNRVGEAERRDRVCLAAGLVRRVVQRAGGLEVRARRFDLDVEHGGEAVEERRVPLQLRFGQLVAQLACLHQERPGGVRVGRQHREQTGGDQDLDAAAVAPRAALEQPLRDAPPVGLPEEDEGVAGGTDSARLRRLRFRRAGAAAQAALLSRLTREGTSALDARPCGRGGFQPRDVLLGLGVAAAELIALAGDIPRSVPGRRCRPASTPSRACEAQGSRARPVHRVRAGRRPGGSVGRRRWP